MEILKTAQPALVRVGILTNSQNILTASTNRTVESWAQKLNGRAQIVDVRNPDELDAALTVAKAQTDGIVLGDEQVITGGDSPRRIADFALRNRLPSSGTIDYAHVGGLIGYGVDWTDVIRRSMAFVDKILKGAKPADLPIQQASKFELVINLKTHRR